MKRECRVFLHGGLPSLSRSTHAEVIDREIKTSQQGPSLKRKTAHDDVERLYILPPGMGSCRCQLFDYQKAASLAQYVLAGDITADRNASLCAVRAGLEMSKATTWFAPKVMSPFGDNEDGPAFGDTHVNAFAL